ncbi:MAG: PD-(D/E)XK nuclease domain-containing protein, partial [bacterium]
YQTGYITIKSITREYIEEIYKLGFPNKEVKNAFLNHLLGSFIEKQSYEIEPLTRRMLISLREEKIEEFIRILRGMISGIPSKLHLKHEYYYQSIFYMIMALMGMKVNLEVPTDKGQIDGVLELEEKIYIIEFKMGEVEKAIKQIKDKKYYEQYLNSKKKIYLLGVGGFEKKELEYVIN